MKNLGDDDELEKLVKEAEANLEDEHEENAEAYEKLQKRKEEIEGLKQALRTARSLGNRDWATELIKGSVDSAIVAQHLALQDIEDDYQSKKIASLSELTNAITNGAKEVVNMEHSEKQLEIQQEKNQIRKNEMLGRKGQPLIEGDGEAVAIGSNKDLLKMIRGGVDVTGESKEQSKEE